MNFALFIVNQANLILLYKSIIHQKFKILNLKLIKINYTF